MTPFEVKELKTVQNAENTMGWGSSDYGDATLFVVGRKYDVGNIMCTFLVIPPYTFVPISKEDKIEYENRTEFDTFKDLRAYLMYVWLCEYTDVDFVPEGILRERERRAKIKTAKNNRGYSPGIYMRNVKPDDLFKNIIGGIDDLIKRNREEMEEENADTE